MKLPLRWNLMMTNKKEKSFFFVCMDCFLLHVTQMQGRGIGSGILADVRAAMKAAGYDYLSLVCVENNEEAMTFWKSQGFAPTGEEQMQDGYRSLKLARAI